MEIYLQLQEMWSQYKLPYHKKKQTTLQVTSDTAFRQHQINMFAPQDSWCRARLWKKGQVVWEIKLLNPKQLHRNHLLLSYDDQCTSFLKPYLCFWQRILWWNRYSHRLNFISLIGHEMPCAPVLRFIARVTLRFHSDSRFALETVETIIWLTLKDLLNL